MEVLTPLCLYDCMRDPRFISCVPVMCDGCCLAAGNNTNAVLIISHQYNQPLPPDTHNYFTQMVVKKNSEKDEIFINQKGFK